MPDLNPRESYGQLSFVNNTIESVTGDIDIQIGLVDSTANLKLNRNTVLAAGKTLGLVDVVLDIPATLSASDGVIVVDGAEGLRVGDIEIFQDTIESTSRTTDIQLGNLAATADLVLNRNTKLASGKSLTFGDNTVQTSAPGATSTTFNPQFTDLSGTLAGVTATAKYTRVGKLCFFRVYVDFNGYTNLGTGQYQITLPFASVATMTSRDGTLHNTSTASIYHITGIVDAADSTTIMKFYYSGSTTDLGWKYNTPVSWANNSTHFDISGVYEVA